MKMIYRLLMRVDKLLNEGKVAFLKKRLKHCGSNVFIHPSCHIMVPEQMSIGNNTSISSFTTVFATYGVTIGANCLVSSSCGISSYNHVVNSLNRHEHVQEDAKVSKPVVIGNNVWIGMNACILPGVTIGDNSIVGSGSVVTKNIPGNEVWAGNPARCLKKLSVN